MNSRVLKYAMVALLVSSTWMACTEKELPAGEDLTAIPYTPTPWEVILPAGWPQLEVPADNPMTEEGIDLGRHLFYDNILSADNTQSCASCHFPAAGFTDNLAVSTGIDGIAGTRSAMSLVNIGLVQPTFTNTDGLFFWDGKVRTLEEQALLPIEDPIELHNEWPTVIKELKESDLYKEKFRKAFGVANTEEITKELAAKAIAQFERSLLSYQSKFDRWEAGLTVFTDEEREGFSKFIDSDEIPFSNQLECSHCHALPTTTSNDFENNALQPAATLMDFVDIGRGRVTGRAQDNGKMRIPTLRNIALSAPYMHDGRFATLEEVVDHYMSGGHFSPNVSPFVHDISAKAYTEQDKIDMLAFLNALTDTTFINDPKIQNPFE